VSAIDDIARRFAGVDIMYRRHGFDSRCIGGVRSYPWRARLVTSKNERCEYRVTAYGKTREEAEQGLVSLVEELDAK
jgi:hypothetical protein